MRISSSVDFSPPTPRVSWGQREMKYVMCLAHHSALSEGSVDCGIEPGWGQRWNSSQAVRRWKQTPATLGLSWQSTEPAAAPPANLSSRELLELPKSIHPGGKTWLDLKHLSWGPVTAFKDQASCQGSWGVLLHLRGYLMILVPLDGASLQAHPHGGEHQGLGIYPTTRVPAEP